MDSVWKILLEERMVAQQKKRPGTSAAHMRPSHSVCIFTDVTGIFQCSRLPFMRSRGGRKLSEGLLQRDKGGPFKY